MLLVATSGFVGRYLYGKIHLGLYGRKAQIGEILAEAEALKSSLGDEFLAGEHVAGKLNAFSQKLAERQPQGLVSSIVKGGSLEFTTRLLRRRLIADARRLIRQDAKKQGWSWWERRRRLTKIVEIIHLYFRTVQKAAQFVFFERLFALWHVLHLPLFCLMLMAGIVHVWAVHHY
jgi:hypothetical protein